MMYSELVEMAIYELNLTKKDFAKEMGISISTVYRIIDNESLLPDELLLEKLETRGIDISVLNYDDIYYNYVSTKYGDEYEWLADIENERLKLRHKKCKHVFYLHKDLLNKYKCLCPICGNR